ncbi:hypothetical protein [Gottfriedia acidiceleris]|uniref:hypothetical protein n=1 Tax=Gottfriedia acidiceleris TaxID=371036 RepID=UPI00101D930D|nr:hypothetical protein [Gottfriedia acidiceleris]
MSFLDSEKYDVEYVLQSFTKFDLFTSSLKLFKALEFPVYQKAHGENLDITNFIYSYVNKNILFSPNEYDFLYKIKTISMLFSLDNKLQEKKTKLIDLSTNQILFMAIELNSSLRDRSYDAHNISKIINKIFKCPVFILFHSDNNILFSGVVNESSCKEYSNNVYLSDWFNYRNEDNKIFEIISQLSFGNHVQTTMYNFYYDLLYSISREYYVFPLSKEYFTYGCLVNEFNPLSLDVNISIEVNSYKRIKEYSSEYSNYYREKYGDDYVDNSESIELLLIDEEENLLLEFEEDLFLDFEIEIEQESNLEDELDIEDNEYMNELMEEADDDLFDDPLKLLEWIETES